MNIPFARPCFDHREIEAVEQVMRSGWITTGDRTREFEERFADYIGARHAVALNSCTAGLHVALAAEGIGAGDEVITTPYTFVATAEAICYLGARPVLADIDPRTRNIDPTGIAAKITPRTKAVVPVHIAGLPCEMDPVLQLAEKHGLAVIEDAAHALPSAYKGRRIGTIGKATAFSFYATKNLTTAEGGMLTTDDAELAARYRRLSLHGMSSDGFKRYRTGGKWYYEIVEMGYKYNLTDLAAAIGIVQLAKLDEFDRRRHQIAARFSEGLAGIEGLELPVGSPEMHHAWHLYILGIDAARCGVGREQFIERMAERGVGTSVHFIPIHMHPFYERHLGHRPEDFPEAEAAFRKAVSLPIYPSMSDEQADYVVESVKECLGHGAARR